MDPLTLPIMILTWIMIWIFIVAAFDGDKIFWYENDGSQSFTERPIDASVSMLRGKLFQWT